MAFLKLADVVLVEETESLKGDNVERVIPSWTASIETRVRESLMDPFPGPLVIMNRSGDSAQDALKALREAVEKEGWELK